MFKSGQWLGSECVKMLPTDDIPTPGSPRLSVSTTRLEKGAVLRGQEDAEGRAGTLGISGQSWDAGISGHSPGSSLVPHSPPRSGAQEPRKELGLQLCRVPLGGSQHS